MRYLERYVNESTKAVAFKRLAVKEQDGLFFVVKEIDYGNGAGVQEVKMPIKPYKTRKGAEAAMMKWKPTSYRTTLVEGLMQEGKI